MSSNTAGAVLFLIDESAAMGGALVQTTTTKHAAMTTALNALLGQLGEGPELAISILGYQTDAVGNASVAHRWGGSLAGRDWVTPGEYLAGPVRTEPRSRKMPDGSQQQISFPIWYEARLGAKAPTTAGFQAAHALLASWISGPGALGAPPLLVHVLAGPSNDGNPDQPVQEIMQLRTARGAALLFHLHLTASATAPVVVYPSNRALLPAGHVRELFEWSSPLPTGFVDGLKAAKLNVQSGARGLVYNARAAELIRFLGQVKDYARACASWSEAPAAAAPTARTTSRLPPVPKAGKPVPGPAAPAAKTVPATPSFGTPAPVVPVVPPGAPTVPPIAAAAPAASTPAPSPEPSLAAASTLPHAARLPVEPSRLIVLLLDRSAEDSEAQSATDWSRLQERANEMLRAISKGGNQLTCLMVTYGRDGSGQPDVLCGLDGSLAGRTFIPASELSEGALRIDEMEEQIPNGIGGILTVTRKKPIFLERPPAAACSPVPAFQEVARLLREWHAQYREGIRPTIVLHCTRGKQLPGEIDEAASSLLAELGQNAVLYHLVLTETPMRSLSYPSSDADLQDSTLQKLWQHSSPLLGRETLKTTKPFLDDNSRGFVLNGKFDLLLPQ